MEERNVASPEDIYSFWFEELTAADWFTKSDELDARMRNRFSATHLALARGDLGAWRHSPRDWLAAIVLLDQFPRNMYRETPLAFSTDWLALREAVLAVEAGADQMVGPDERCFFYLPFEHSEDIADQDRSVELFSLLGDKNYLDYAVRHRDVIRKFGRFPHRNAILGRKSTRAELDYLSQPGAGF